MKFLNKLTLIAVGLLICNNAFAYEEEASTTKTTRRARVRERREGRREQRHHGHMHEDNGNSYHHRRHYDGSRYENGNRYYRGEYGETGVLAPVDFGVDVTAGTAELAGDTVGRTTRGIGDVITGRRFRENSEE